jgi:Anti-sigma-K factor rskA
MTCEELREEYDAYALGIAEDPEKAEIAGHIARKCPNCVPGVAGALAVVASMSGAVRTTEPPKRLRQRVKSLVAPGPARPLAGIFVPWAIAAVLSIALIVIGVAGRRQNADTAQLAQALAILNDPATRDVTFGETAKPSRGRVFVSLGKGVVFIGANLPGIGPGKTFELWIIPASGMPSPAGTFQAQSDATAVYVRPGAVENAAAIAVTVEPEGGSPQPTTTPFIVARLS